MLQFVFICEICVKFPFLAQRPRNEGEDISTGTEEGFPLSFTPVPLILRNFVLTALMYLQSYMNGLPRLVLSSLHEALMPLHFSRTVSR